MVKTRKLRKRSRSRGGRHQNTPYPSKQSLKAVKLIRAAGAAKPPVVQNLPANETLLLVDPDAPQPHFVHWIYRNGQHVLPYMPPNPPPGQQHHYIFYRTTAPVQPPKSRAGFALPGHVIYVDEFIFPSTISSGRATV